MKDRIARIYGVGEVEIYGERQYSMRIWLDPDRLAHVDMTPSQVAAALREQNRQVAAGKLNQEPLSNPDAAYELIINTQGRLETPDEFENIVIKNEPGGKIVLLRDVARVELGAYEYSDQTKLDGRECIGIACYQLPGSNAIETAEKIRSLLVEMKRDFPAGLDYIIGYDITEYIQQSIDAVYRTIFEAVALVVFVMMLFCSRGGRRSFPYSRFPCRLWARSFSCTASVFQ